VGDLLRNALALMGVAGVVHGPIRDIKTAIGQIIDGAIDSLVGIPAQVLALARHPDSARIPPGRIRSILLSTDYVPRAVTAALRQTWDCDVFQHYGMTEMGYGGGVGCAAHDGYHLREADLLFEIVDPVTGQPVRDGRQGEVVFTTLNRRAMPLIRYRTGDLAAWIEAPCPCGSVLRRMGWVQGRRRDKIRLADGSLLDPTDLDEALFPLPEVIDFQAAVGSTPEGDLLHVTLCTHRSGNDLTARALAALNRVPLIRSALAGGALRVGPMAVIVDPNLTGSAAKRKIVDQRVQGGSDESHR
jgi:phenylacetate-CoA ligase